METAVALHRSFFPKIRLTLILNWQVFWLTSLFAAFPSNKEQWQRLQKVIQRFTAAGTAPVLHRIPFSDDLRKKEVRQPGRDKSRKYFLGVRQNSIHSFLLTPDALRLPRPSTL